MIDYKKLKEKNGEEDSPLFIEWKTEEQYFEITIMEEPQIDDNKRYSKNKEWVIAILLNGFPKLLPLSVPQSKQFFSFMEENNIQLGDRFKFRAYKKKDCNGEVLKNSPFKFKFKPIDEDNLESKIDTGDKNERNNTQRLEETQRIDEPESLEADRENLGGATDDCGKILEAAEIQDEDEHVQTKSSNQQPQTNKILNFLNEQSSNKAKTILRNFSANDRVKMFNIIEKRWDNPNTNYQIKLGMKRYLWWEFELTSITSHNTFEDITKALDELEKKQKALEHSPDDPITEPSDEDLFD